MALFAMAISQEKKRTREKKEGEMRGEMQLK